MDDLTIKLERGKYNVTKGWIELNQEMTDWCICNLKDWWTLEYHIKQMPLTAREQPLSKFLPEMSKYVMKRIDQFVVNKQSRRELYQVVWATWAEIQFTSEEDMLKFKLFWT